MTRAIDDKIGRVLDLDVEAAAAAILRVANDKMAGAIRLVSSRGAWFDKGWLDTPVYERDRLPLESEFRGPAILEQLDATTIIEPDDYAHVDAFGNVLIKVA